MPSNPVDAAGYPVAQVVNETELPLNAAAKAVVPDWIISSSLWASSPAGPAASGGPVIPSLPDAAPAQR